MNGDKYVISCPHCGRVEGYSSTLEEEERDRDKAVEDTDVDSGIEEDVFEMEGVPVRRIRCPRCGSWISPDLAAPA